MMAAKSSIVHHAHQLASLSRWGLTRVVSGQGTGAFSTPVKVHRHVYVSTRDPEPGKGRFDSALA